MQALGYSTKGKQVFEKLPQRSTKKPVIVVV